MPINASFNLTLTSNLNWLGKTVVLVGLGLLVASFFLDLPLWVPLAFIVFELLAFYRGWMCKAPDPLEQMVERAAAENVYYRERASRPPPDEGIKL